jgi:hypothetical protein
MSTNTNVKALSAKGLLLDWVSGMGATGKTPDTWEHVQDGYLHGKQISLALLTAIAEMKCIGTPISFDEAIALGYLSKNHVDQHSSGSATTKKTPFENTKAVINAETYWNNCIKLGLSPDNADKVSGIVTAFYSISDKATKADLTSLLAELVHVFMSPEQHVTYSIKLEDERIAAAKFAALTDAGFIDIRTMSEGRYVANLATSLLGNVAVLTASGFIPVGMQAVNAELYQITFKDLEPAQV